MSEEERALGPSARIAGLLMAVSGLYLAALPALHGTHLSEALLGGAFILLVPLVREQVRDTRLRIRPRYSSKRMRHPTSHA